MKWGEEGSASQGGVGVAPVVIHSFLGCEFLEVRSLRHTFDDSSCILGGQVEVALTLFTRGPEAAASPRDLRVSSVRVKTTKAKAAAKHTKAANERDKAYCCGAGRKHEGQGHEGGQC